MATVFQKLVGTSDPDVEKFRIDVFLHLLEELDEGFVTEQDIIDEFGLSGNEENQLRSIFSKYQNSQNKEAWLKRVRRFLVLGESRVMTNRYKNEASFSSVINS